MREGQQESNTSSMDIGRAGPRPVLRARDTLNAYHVEWQRPSFLCLPLLPQRVCEQETGVRRQSQDSTLGLKDGS